MFADPLLRSGSSRQHYSYVNDYDSDHLMEDSPVYRIYNNRVEPETVYVTDEPMYNNYVYVDQPQYSPDPHPIYNESTSTYRYRSPPPSPPPKPVILPSPPKRSIAFSSSKSSTKPSSSKSSSLMTVVAERPSPPKPHRPTLNPEVQKEIALIQGKKVPSKASNSLRGPGIKGYKITPTQTKTTLTERFTQEKMIS